MPLTVGPGRALLSSDPYAGLRVGLVSSWRMQEASGTFLDSVGANALTANNSPGTAAGPGAFQARSFVAASSQSASVASNSTLQEGDNTFTLAGWFYATTLGAGERVIVGKYDADGGPKEYLLEWTGSALQWAVYHTSGAAVGSVSHATVPTTGQWYHVVAYQDVPNNQVGLVLNTVAATPQTRTSTIVSGSATFRFGVRNSSPTGFWNGRLALWGLWNRLLTTAEIAQHYNGGAGVLL